MKGRILSYSVLENSGIISGDDNNRYTFLGSEWKDSDTPGPYRGAYVDFVIQGGYAVEIYQTIDPQAVAATPRKSEKKVPAGILAILLGWLGIHKFYLGYTLAGIIHLAIFFVGALIAIGPLIILIISVTEGIIYLTKSDEDFDQTYIIGQKQWF